VAAWLPERSTLSTRAALVLGLLLLVASLSGAFAAGRTLLMRVPFDFRAGESHFAPGEYVLALDGLATGSVTIRSADHGRGAVVQARKAAASGGGAEPTVSFNAYGDSRFLSAIQPGEGGEQWVLAPSADEAALTRAQGQPKVTVLKVERLQQK